MGEEIKPAMTSAQWKDGSVESGPYAVTLDNGHVLEVHGVSVTQIVPAKLRHALAALALHGQGYGFTREDVAVIAALVGAVTASNPSAGDTQAIRQAKSLAAKIAALLPEEEANG